MTDDEKNSEKEQDLPEKTQGEPEEEEDTSTKGGVSIEPDILKQLPPEARSIVDVALTMFRGPHPHPLLGKITEDHISKVLDDVGKENERNFELRKSARVYGVIYTVIAVAVFVFVTIYLSGTDSELYKDILSHLIAIVGGLGGGVGIKVYIDRRRGK